MKIKRDLSLNKELTIVVVVALILNVVLYMILSFVLDSVMDSHFNTAAYYEQQDRKYIAKLQAYVTEHEIESGDWYALNKWSDKEHITYLTIFKNEILTYESGLASTDEIGNETTVMKIENEYEKQSAFQVEFYDGEADVIINSGYADRYYQIIYAIEYLIPAISFALMIFAAVQKKIKYIKLLCNEIHIMEGGDLEHPITTHGRDELGLLASSLEELRKSFIQKLRTIMQLQEDSKGLITEMSHDMRTPMTPLLLYLGMLRDRRYDNSEEMQNYIEKSYEKASQLKHMTDNMFSYFLMDKSANVELENLYMKEVFYDQLSGMSDYLQTSGFKVKIDIGLEDVKILVNTDFIARIMNNIISNILKYADSESAVVIKLYSENGKVILHIGNYINSLADYSNSTGFGVKNINKMMTQMNAECIISQKHESYDTFLLFNIVGIN